MRELACITIMCYKRSFCPTAFSDQDRKFGVWPSSDADIGSGQNPCGGSVLIQERLRLRSVRRTYLAPWLASPFWPRCTLQPVAKVLGSHARKEGRKDARKEQSSRNYLVAHRSSRKSLDTALLHAIKHSPAGRRLLKVAIVHQSNNKIGILSSTVFAPALSTGDAHSQLISSLFKECASTPPRAASWYTGRLVPYNCPRLRQTAAEACTVAMSLQDY